ncbi:MAG: glycosyltransferase family 4 protein [Candidatus Micrarchaeota archaeon]
MARGFSCLVLPNDRLSIYEKQGTISHFFERLEYYCGSLGEVFVLNIDIKPVSWRGSAKVINKRAFGFKPLDLLQQFFWALYYGFKLNPAFFRSFESATFLKSGLFGLAAKLLRKKSVVSIHGTYHKQAHILGFKAYQIPVFKLFEWITKKTHDAAFVIDPMYLEELRWKNIWLIPNFVDTDRFKPVQSRKKWDGLFVGSLTPRKGIPILLDAIAIVKKTLPKARFAVAGFGPQENLVRKADVDYLGGVPHEKLPKIYAQARFLCTATLHEGFAIPVAEAQACGLPVVATDLPPFYNNTIPGKTSLFFPSGDSKKLAGLMASLIRNPEKARRMGLAGRKFVEGRFGKNEVLGKETLLIKRIFKRS